MAVYTGNNGRIYIARSETSGLTGTRTLTISAGQSVAKNQILTVLTNRGEGKGAKMRAGAAVTTTQSSRSVTFTVTSAGDGYAATDTVYLAKYSQGTWVRVTSNFSVGTTLTRGVDSEKEIINDNYRIAKIRNWTYNSNSEVVETTALGDVTKTFAPSITSGDGSATLMFYEDDLNSSAVERQKDIYELVDILFPRSTPPRVIMNLAVDGGISVVDADELQKTNFLFNAYITSASVAVSYGEVVTVDTSFTVDGPLIEVPWRPGVDRL
jgi:hypothetical protein